MSVGLTRREQWALIGLVALIAAGLGIQAWHAGRSEGSVVYVPGQGRWEKLADFEAGQRPQPLATNNPDTPNSQPPTTTATVTGNAIGNATAPRPSQSSSESGGLEINRATAEEFDRLPGIGPAKAHAIIETRTKLGGFSSVDQLDNVPGIGAKTLERLRPYLKLEAAPARASVPASATPSTTPPLPPPHPAAVSAPPATQTAPQPTPKAKEKAAKIAIAAKSSKAPAAGTPLPVVDVNSAPAEELEQITGIGPVLARNIIQERTAHGPFRSPRDLTRVKGIGPRSLLKMLPQVVTGPGAQAQGR